MIQVRNEPLEFIDAQVASGAFSAPEDVVKKAIELLRGAVDANLLSSLEDIHRGIAEEKAGRVRPAGEVLREIGDQLQARK